MQEVSDLAWAIFCDFSLRNLIPTITVGRKNINGMVKFWGMVLLIAPLPLNFIRLLWDRTSTTSLFNTEFVPKTRIDIMPPYFDLFKDLEHQQSYNELTNPIVTVKKAIKKLKRGLDAKKHASAIKRAYRTKRK